LGPCNPHRADGLARLQRRSLELYSDFCRHLHEETGIDPEYDCRGELDLLFTEDAVRIGRADELAGRSWPSPDGQPLFVLHGSDETCRLEPVVSDRILGSLECRITAQVRNPRLLQALKTACLRAGVTIHEMSLVRDFLFDRDRVVGVQLETQDLAARHVVLCAGAWSSRIGEHLSHIMPVHPVRGQMVLIKAERRLFGRVISRGKTYLVPRRDGHTLLGSTEEPEAGFNKRTTAKGVSALLEKAMHMVPSLADAPILATWAGLRPATPDEKPYIGPVPGMEGLIAATGHFRAGLTLAPATAEAVTSLILTRPFDIDLSPFAPGRAVSPHANRALR